MIRFQFMLAVVCAALVANHLSTASAQTVAFFDDFETDEGNDGSLDGDISNSGHFWGDTVVGIVEDSGGDMSVGPDFAWNSSLASGTSENQWSGNTAFFDKVTSGTWYFSMDRLIGNGGGQVQTVLEDTPDTSRAPNVRNHLSSWFVVPGKIAHEGLGNNVDVAVTSFVTGDNVHVEFVYDLDNETITGSFFDNNDPDNADRSGDIDTINFGGTDPPFSPNGFSNFVNAGDGGDRGLDNLRFADTRDDGFTPPPPTVFTWNVDGSGDWTGRNWTPAGPPSTNRHTAIFGDKIMSPQTVFTNSAVTVNRIEFNNANTYVVSGFGSVNVETNTVPTDPSIVVAQGAHQFQAIVNLNGTTTADIASDATLTFNNALNLNGNSLTKTGDGLMEINNVLNTGGGTVILQQGTMSGDGTVNGTLNNDGGTLSPSNSSVVPEPSAAAWLVFSISALLAICRRRST